MDWKVFRETFAILLSVLGILAAGFLAYSDIREVNAVQNAAIIVHSQAIIDLKSDILRSLQVLQDDVRELRKQQGSKQ